MRFAKWLACLFVLAAALPLEARGQDQGFESLIEGVLKQHPDETQPEQPLPQPEQPLPQSEQPQPPLPPSAPFPGAPEPSVVAPPVLVPVEPGPRPYTPPKIAHPAEENPPRQETGTAPAPGATSAPAPSGATAPAAPAEATPGAAPAADQNAAAAGTAEAGAERTRESLTVEEVNAAVLPAELTPFKGANPLVLKAQVLLDRAGASPGVIDAYAGGNLSKAIAAVETVLGLAADGVLDPAVWDALGGDAAPAVLKQYTITAEDLAYPFVASIPADAMEQSRLPSLGYSSVEEMLGERFHMDTKLLAALNPSADFHQAGTQVWVTAIDGPPITENVARIVADRALSQVRAYDAGNHLIVAYPATIGSTANPSPIGDHIVSAVTRDPTFQFSAPDGSGTIATLPAGPNNPLGTILIELTDPGYDINGSADPSKVGKPASEGCVRLTNWDAEELARLVVPGVLVSFQ